MLEQLLEQRNAVHEFRNKQKIDRADVTLTSAH